MLNNYYSKIEHVGDLPKKLQIALLIKAISHEYYSIESAGDCCHIILDDGNYTDEDIKHCIEFYAEKNDCWGGFIATLLKSLTEEQRKICLENDPDTRYMLNQAEQINPFNNYELWQ